MTYLINNNGDELYTTVFAKDAKETVILLHGGPGVPDDFTEVIKILSDKYQIITFHQRGTNKSPCRSGDYSINAYDSDIEAIIRYFNINKFHVFGHSWGGLYAQIYGQQHPERLLSLFLCCPGSGTGNQWKVTECEVMKFNKSKTSSAEWLSMCFNSLSGMLGRNAGYQKLFKQVVKNYNKDYGLIPEYIDFQNLNAEAINKTRKEIIKYPVLKNCPNLKLNITTVYGSRDIYSHSKKFVLDRYPEATVQTIENCGHFPWFHNPTKFKTIMSEHYKL
jgi:proline iminopeptidase